VSLLRDFTDKPIKANPVFVLALGLCPTLAVTTAVRNGVAMALASTAVLVGSNLLISLIRRAIPAEVRIVCYIVVIAGFVTMVEIVMKAVAPPEVNEALGIFIPLIVVNCIILGRAEGFASRHGPAPSLMDALGIGTGFLGALVAIALVREVLGAGTLWGYALTPVAVGGTVLVPKVEPMRALVMAPGAFIVIGLLFGLFRALGNRRALAERAGAAMAVARTAKDFPKKKPRPKPPAGDSGDAKPASGDAKD
jgi:electron transport complex protein RnfE